MASNRFSDLTAAVAELRRLYLPVRPNTPLPLPDDQELARAFVVLTHAEIEFFLEESFRALLAATVFAADRGRFGNSALAMLTFTKLEPLSGGDVVSGRKANRTVLTRLGKARSEVESILSSNNGVREEFIAKMGNPLGIGTYQFDGAWLSELDQFCTLRGGIAHGTRASGAGAFLSMNPIEIWTRCQSVIWNSSSQNASLKIASLQRFDEVISNEIAKLNFGLRPKTLTDRVIGWISRALGL